MELVDDVAVRLTVSVKDLSCIVGHIDRVEILRQNENHADIVVYWGLEEMQRLARLYPNSDVPSPMNHDYDWPGLYTPFKHQRITAAYLALRERAFCFNEAGTGKTSSVIWAADYLMKKGLVKRVLVVCPVSIMYTAWQDDLFKTAMHRTTAVAHGSAAKRKKILEGDYEFVIINYDGVAIVADEIRASGFDLIVIDEANAYKTATTKRWKVMNKIASTSRLWMLTGTPASQSPMDAYGLAKLLYPNKVPKYVSSWRDQVMYQVSRFKWMPKPNARASVHTVLQPAIRFEKAQCLDLPPVTYQTRVVALSNQVLTYYKLIRDQMLVRAGTEKITAVNAAAQVSKLLQISGGAVYADGGAVLEFDIKPRLSELSEVIEETSNKILVFVPFKHTIDIVSEYLTSQGVTNEVISGDVTAVKRADIINRFQSQENPRVLVIQPQSAAHGITLTAADTVVFWSPVSSVEVYLQCIARIDRQGQKNSMTVVHLQGSEIERHMYKMLQGKVELHEKLVDLYKQELGIE